MSDRKRGSGPVVVLGGSGSFGRLLIADLLVRTDLDIVSVTRSGIPADGWLPGSEGRLVDRRADAGDGAVIAAVLESLKPSVLVHAAGPYLKIGDAPLRCAIQHGVPYVDLCPSSRLYGELRARFDAAARRANVPCVLGASTVGGITGVLTRHAHATLASVERIRTVLCVHNFSWGAGTVADYLLSARSHALGFAPGSHPETVFIPGKGYQRVSLADTLEYADDFRERVADTEHRFGLDSILPRLGMRLAEACARIGLPVWRAAGLLGKCAGLLGGDRTEGGLLHRAFGADASGACVLETHVHRPFGNVRNPALLAALTASALAGGRSFSSGFVHPASWIDPEALIAELRARANVVRTRTVRSAAELDEPW